MHVATRAGEQGCRRCASGASADDDNVAVEGGLGHPLRLRDRCAGWHRGGGGCGAVSRVARTAIAPQPFGPVAGRDRVDLSSTVFDPGAGAFGGDTRARDTLTTFGLAGLFGLDPLVEKSWTVIDVSVVVGHTRTP